MVDCFLVVPVSSVAPGDLLLLSLKVVDPVREFGYFGLVVLLLSRGCVHEEAIVNDFHAAAHWG